MKAYQELAATSVTFSKHLAISICKSTQPSRVVYKMKAQFLVTRLAPICMLSQCLLMLIKFLISTYKISASELSWKFIKSALLVGYYSTYSQIKFAAVEKHPRKCWQLRCTTMVSYFFPSQFRKGRVSRTHPTSTRRR